MRQPVKRLLYSLIISLLIIASLPLQALAVAHDPKSGHEHLSIRFWEDKAPPIGFYINASARYILETVEAPAMGSTFGEWSVMDLLRAKYTGYDYINHIPLSYFTDYTKRIENYVAEQNGILDFAKSTEWSRLMLTLSAMGHDVHNVAGYNFPSYLSTSHKFSYRQGINGPIWEIIAMNTGGYQFTDDPNNPDANTFGKMIDYILQQEISGGGWALFGQEPDPDITGMALQALAPYYANKTLYEKTGATTSYDNFIRSVENAIAILAKLQQPHGGFNAWGNVNAESTTQVIVALTALNIDPLSTKVVLPAINETVSFIKQGAVQDGVETNNMIDSLLTFWAKGSGSSAEVGGFKHITTGFDGGGGSGTGVNAMATDQALYGLIAYDRFLKKQNSLYDMTDMLNGQHKTMVATNKYITLKGNGVVEDSQKIQSPYSVLIVPQEAGVASWNTKQDGTGVKYLPLDKLVIPEHDIVLYAQGHTTAGEYDQQAITKVEALINELPSPAHLKREDENQVVRARANYDKLTTRDQQKVTNYNVLLVAEGKMRQLTTQYDDELKVENLIRTIDDLAAVSPLTVDYQLAIENARRDYNALTATQRIQITNLDKLRTLEAKIVILKEQHDKELEEAINNASSAVKVKSLMTAIAKLPAVITLNDVIEVKKLRMQYDALTKKEQAEISNITLLLAAEARINELTQGEVKPPEENTSKKMVEQVKQLIASLPKLQLITLEDTLNIKKARSYYESLTATQKNQITNYAILVDAERKLDQLFKENISAGGSTTHNSDFVKETIAKLPPIHQVTLQDVIEVKKARIFYDALPVDQRGQVSNYSTLQAIEKRIDDLTKEALEQEEFEDDAADDSFGEMVIKGQTLVLTSNKSAGDFKVEIPIKDLRKADEYNLKQVEVTDKRGVKWLLDWSTLKDTIKHHPTGEHVVFGVTQYNYDSGKFSVTLHIKEGQRKNSIQVDSNYAKVYIPYRFFIDGKDLHQQTVLRQQVGELQTASYIASAQGITLNLKKSETFIFSHEKASFSDIAQLSNREEVLYLAERKVIQGVGGKFNPNHEITRGQFATMIVRALGIEPKAQTSQFIDVRGKWYEADIQALFEAGITTGTSATTFNPEGKLSRQQAAVLMARVLRYTGFDTENIPADMNFKDAKAINSAYLKDIGILNRLGIMTGNPNKEFMPATNLTRAQMAKILKRTLGIGEML